MQLQGLDWRDLEILSRARAPKDRARLSCPAQDCPLQERLQDNWRESFWDCFLQDLGDVPGTIKISSATTGDFVNRAILTLQRVHCSNHLERGLACGCQKPGSKRFNFDQAQVRLDHPYTLEQMRSGGMI